MWSLASITKKALFSFKGDPSGLVTSTCIPSIKLKESVEFIVKFMIENLKFQKGFLN